MENSKNEIILMKAKSLPNIFLSIEAGTTYEEFADSLAELLLQNNTQFNELPLPMIEQKPNGDLEIFVVVGDQTHACILPKGHWMRKDMDLRDLTAEATESNVTTKHYLSISW
jgi:hypothetical protein